MLATQIYTLEIYIDQGCNPETGQAKHSASVGTRGYFVHSHSSNRTKGPEPVRVLFNVSADDKSLARYQKSDFR